MQSVSQIIGTIAAAPKGKAKSDPLLEPEHIVCAAWARAVGKKIAKYTRAAKLVRGRLVIEVEDVMWQRNLFGMRGHILTNLAKTIGPGLVLELEFRVMPLRREPQRAGMSTAQRDPLALFDEADGIADPGMRRLYKVARQRELA
jgi:predicted nucleic acid-binding Zn ribbon protein